MKIISFFIVLIFTINSQNLTTLTNTKWFVKEVKIESMPEYIYPEQLLKCHYYLFNSNGTSLVNSTYGEISGTWKLNKDSLYIFANDTMELEIVKLDENEMIWKSKVDTLNLTFVLSTLNNNDCK